MKVSFSRLHKYEACPRQYWYQYERKLRTKTVSANLIFGKSVHAATTEYIAKHALGESFDPVKVFRESWDKATEATEVEYSSTRNPKDMRDTGSRLCELFVPYWENSGMSALIGPGDNPLVENHFGVEITPQITLHGYLDVVAMTNDGEVAILDLKTSMQPAPEAVLLVGEQLTDYQMMIEANGEKLGLDGVDRLGFINMLKRKIPKTNRGKGPQIEASPFVSPRSEDVINERKQKIAWMVENIMRGAFFRAPKMGYDTPCEMCDFKNICLHGSMEGLIDTQAGK